MALTLSEVERGVVGDLRYVIMNVTFDATYPAGGESLTAADLGFTSDVFLVTAAAALHSTPTTALVPVYNHATNKLIALEGNYDAADGPLQEDATADLSAFSCRIFALGR